MVSVTKASLQPQRRPNRRGCLFYVKRGLKWFGITLVALIVLGVAYQTIATELDKSNYAPRGQLYNVNGSQMHLVCMGEGGPTVILQAGLTAESLWWYWVQNQMAEHTQVCAYDRPGLGWSEPVTGSRDAFTIVDELHTLLEQAGVSAPYVMVGHSYGAIWTRIYAAQYPQEIAGIVLVDSGLVAPKHFDSPSEAQSWQNFNSLTSTVIWGLTRTGVIRLTALGDALNAGYPPDIAREIASLQPRNQTFDTYYAEAFPDFAALQEASAGAENLDDLPIEVLWASITYTGMQNLPQLNALADELSTYSSNSVTRIVEGADHGSILGNEAYAQQVTGAILDVIEAARTGEPLA